MQAQHAIKHSLDTISPVAHQLAHHHPSLFPPQSAVRGSDTPSTDTCGVATPNLTPASSWQQPATTAGQGSTSNGHANPAPNQPWEIEPEELEIVQDGENKPIVLGAGGCGEVLRGVRGGVQDVAIKVLCGNAAQGPGDALVKEIQVLKDLRDRNVVQFYGAVIREGRMMLVTEYMPGGRSWGVGCVCLWGDVGAGV